MKYINITEIESSSPVINAIIVTPVLNTEREQWGTCSVLRKVNDGVYICSCSVISEEYMCKTKHAFVYDKKFKPLEKQECLGISLIIEHMQPFVL